MEDQNKVNKTPKRE